MIREASENPEVHRELIVQSPPQEGRDVANLQRALQARLKARGLADDVPVPTHGKFTHATWLAAVEAGYFLGLTSKVYLMVDKGRGVSTEGAQRFIRSPDKRLPEQLERAKVRAAVLGEGPRYYDDLAQAAGVSAGHGAEAALAWAAKQIGTVEHPAGSNWGPKIEGWIRMAGYTSPVPWCGCFVNAACMAGGVPSGAGWIGYTPAIITHAKSGKGGWSWHTTAKRADLALFDAPGGDPAQHVAMVEKPIAPGHDDTIEGNTSSGPGGSQDNGGGVFRRDRVSTPNWRIVGYARPPWPS